MLIWALATPIPPQSPATPPEQPPPQPAALPTPTPTPSSPPSPSAEEKHSPEPHPHPCARLRGVTDTSIDHTRRVLAETLCRASLWFDGLFGANEHPDAARNAFGRAEVSVLTSQYEGTKLGARFNARVDLPNVRERFNAFAGRDDEEDFVRDRREGAALRSPVREFERNESWLAGFGYSLPGDYRQRIDFRAGARLSTAPKLFFQGRWRRNVEISETTLLHFRETLFWTNRDGFGLTSAVEFDRVLTDLVLFRWAGVGTVSQRSEGLDWRSHALVFYNIPGPHAVAVETFIRGKTRAEVPLREYGTRLIYRRRLGWREWLYGEAYAGYSWPRRYLDERREGSAALGVGVELLFGQD